MHTHTNYCQAHFFEKLVLKSQCFLGECDFYGISTNQTRKIATSRESSFSAHLLRFSLHYAFIIRIRRWECPMICTISSTICGLKTSLLVSSLDKHMPWISGHQHRNKPRTQPVIRKTTSTPPMNCPVLPTSTFEASNSTRKIAQCERNRILKPCNATQKQRKHFTILAKSLHKTGVRYTQWLKIQNFQPMCYRF